MQQEQRVQLFRSGADQTLRIPQAFELPGDEVIIRSVAGTLVIKPLERPSLSELLAGWTALDVTFPDIDAGLLPLDDVTP